MQPDHGSMWRYRYRYMCISTVYIPILCIKHMVYALYVYALYAPYIRFSAYACVYIGVMDYALYEAICSVCVYAYMCVVYMRLCRVPYMGDTYRENLPSRVNPTTRT